MLPPRPILTTSIATLIAGLTGPAAALAAGPVAQIDEPGGYISYWRVLIILIAQIPWLAFCQWVDADTQIIRRMRRETWNGIVLGGGTAGLAVWLLMPWSTPGLFAAGFGLWFVITVGTCGVYVIMRNGHVDAGSRVFTARHIQGYLKGLGKSKQVKLDAVEQVRITTNSGEKVAVPSDPTQTDTYEAAQNLLFDAIWRRATEVELLVAGSGYRLAYRIDGAVTPRNDLFADRDAAERALLFVKKVSGLDLEERRRPQNGSISAAMSGSNAPYTEVEVNTSGTTQHERLHLKIVGEENRLRIADLGMTEKQQERFEEVCKAPSGLVVVSGPKQSGVTTTLYAALRNHDAFMQNLLSLEREPLMELENITQNIYDSTKHEASYARQLQTVLRREPDVVMVSECADRETAHLAAKAACDGKKVYVGMQARDCFDALKKLVSLAGDMEAVSKGLLAVTCQRLIRKVCIACRLAYQPDPQLLKKANLPVGKIEHFYRPPRPEEWVDEKGKPKGVCTNCQGSGYFGRTGVFELLEIDNGIRELIEAGQPISAIRAQARKNGMLYLQEVGLQKVIDGVSAMHEMLRVFREEEANPGGRRRPAPGPKKAG